MSRKTRLMSSRTKVNPYPVEKIVLDPLALKEVKRIIKPHEKYVILSTTEALIVPR